MFRDGLQRIEHPVCVDNLHLWHVADDAEDDKAGDEAGETVDGTGDQGVLGIFNQSGHKRWGGGAKETKSYYKVKKDLVMLVWRPKRERRRKEGVSEDVETWNRAVPNWKKHWKLKVQAVIFDEFRAFNV